MAPKFGTSGLQFGAPPPEFQRPRPQTPRFCPKIREFYPKSASVFPFCPFFHHFRVRRSAPPLVGVTSPLIGRSPQAVFTYWLTSNSFSLLQTGLLRIPALRAKLGVAPPLAPPQAPPTGPAPPAKGGLLRQLRKGEGNGAKSHDFGAFWGVLFDFVGLGGVWGEILGFSVGF